MKRKLKVKNLYAWIIMIVVIVVIYFPIYWLVAMSFKTQVDIVSTPPKWIFEPTLGNYEWLATHSDVLGGLKRSLIVAFSSTALALVIGVPAGYGIARFNFKHKDDIAFWILSTRFLPPIAALIPFLVIWLALGMFDTYATLIVMHLVLNLPLVIWLSSKFLKEVPTEVEDAAMVDGCTRLTALVKIVLPQAGPGLAVAAMFAFVFSWNEFFFAFVLTSTKSTLPVVVSGFLAHGHEIKWGSLASAAIIASIPALIMVVAARKIIAKGFTQMVVD